VWQKAHQFVLEVYRLSGKFPSIEKFCLVSQIRRAAISVPANIAESFRKHTSPDKTRYLNIAQGSLEEVRYYLILARDLDYTHANDAYALLEETSKLLDRYKRAIMKNS
jgi:four helix bundle protein